ncbi:TPA: hypothetical protein DCL30_03325 [Candidatus Peribacteria bacterium]|nr:MAG: hypothetical protein A2529_05380 [Candidatus Peribacteria bacterium RIFOXYD2_FULL_58_15]HAI98545.1 hypothetical protein [Candidatus Peribacteria bacterium]HAS34258.1 hypothetical protein [Candidatus Peribacteria bacterium]
MANRHAMIGILAAGMFLTAAAFVWHPFTAAVLDVGITESGALLPTETGSVISGMVYREDGLTPAGQGIKVAVSVQGETASVRSVTDLSSRYMIEVPLLPKSAILTIYIEEMAEKAVTVASASADLSALNLIVQKMIVVSPDEQHPVTSADLTLAARNGGVPNQDIDTIFSPEAASIEVHSPYTLSVPAGSAVEFAGPLKAANIALAGTMLQGEGEITVEGLYRQTGGFFRAGKLVTFAGDFTLDGGTFEGGDATVKMTNDFLGMFAVNGGVFSAPTMLLMSHTWIQTGGSFKCNEGTVSFDGTSHIIDVGGALTFYDLIVNKVHGSNLDIAAGNDLVVLNTLALTDGYINGGSLTVRGGLNHSVGFDGGTALIRVEGTAARDIVLAGGGSLPRMTFNAPGSVIRVSGSGSQAVQILGEFSLLNGTFLVESGNVQFFPTAPFVVSGGQFIASGSGNTILFEAPVRLEKGSMSFAGGAVTFSSSTDFLDGTLSIEGGDLTFNGMTTMIGGSVRALNGSLTFNSLWEMDGGQVNIYDATVIVNSYLRMLGGIVSGGQGSMIFQNTFSLAGGSFTAPSGSLTFAGDVTFSGGDFHHNGGTVIFGGFARTLDFGTVREFNHVIVQKEGQEKFTVGGVSLLKVLGNLTLVSGTLGAGGFEVRGNVKIEDMVGGGSGSLIFTGSKEQTLTVKQEAEFSGSYFIRKSGGRVILASPLELIMSGQEIRIRSGIFDTAGFTVKAEPPIARIVVEPKGTLRWTLADTVSTPVLEEGATVAYAPESGTGTIKDLPYTSLIIEAGPNALLSLPQKGLKIGGNFILRSGIFRMTGQEFIVGGNWIRDGGEFITGSGTVVLKGRVQELVGDNTFYNLKKRATSTDASDTLVFGSGSTQRVESKLELAGTGCTFLRLRSTAKGAQWKVDMTGTSSLLSLDVRDARGEGADTIPCTTECVNRGNATNWTFKNQKCTFVATDCGNGVQEPGEDCDDGNLRMGDGCSPLCKAEGGFTCSGNVCRAVCGDSQIIGKETCDDGNKGSDDGCSNSCVQEDGYVCEEEPSVCKTVCGDGQVSGKEECDDGNAVSSDGCNSSCMIENGFTCLKEQPSTCTSKCGDGLVATIEECDDGNGTDGDGCSVSCTLESGYGCSGEPSHCSIICGDSVVNGKETCDDGNDLAGDGCSAVCTVETGFVCTASPSVCAPLCGVSGFAEAECADGRHYQALLDGSQQVPPANTARSARILLRLNADATIAYTIMSGLTADDEIAVYAGEIGETGPLRFILSAAGGVTEPLAEEVVEALQAGGLYVNVPGSQFPQGEIRGQILPVTKTARSPFAPTSTETGIPATDEQSLSSQPAGEILPPSGATTEQTAAVCGNGIAEAGEECDDGDQDGSNDCLPTCQKPWCGDGYIHEGTEQCEPPGMKVPDRSDASLMRQCGEDCMYTDVIKYEKAPDETPQGFIFKGGTIGPPKTFTPVARTSSAPSVTQPIVPAGGASPVVVPPASTASAAPQQGSSASASAPAVLPVAKPQSSSEAATYPSSAVSKPVLTSSAASKAAVSSAPARPVYVPKKPLCGDGIIDIGEECDDGNVKSGDGCSEKCILVPVLLFSAPQISPLLKVLTQPTLTVPAKLIGTEPPTGSLPVIILETQPTSLRITSSPLASLLSIGGSVPTDGLSGLAVVTALAMAGAFIVQKRRTRKG